jgi:hypothetical protein
MHPDSCDPWRYGRPVGMLPAPPRTCARSGSIASTKQTAPRDPDVVQGAPEQASS